MHPMCLSDVQEVRVLCDGSPFAKAKNSVVLECHVTYKLSVSRLRVVPVYDGVDEQCGHY